jgi:uncharacterized cupredoxin-like copper-binding protein
MVLEGFMKKIPFLFVMISALWLSACGGSGAVTSLDMTISDYEFTPDRFAVPAGQEITLRVDNQGLTSHQFVIFELGTDPGEKFGPEDQENVYFLFEVKPGRAESVVFTAPSEPGEYYFACGIFGHLEAGMIGTLIVVEE